MLGTGSAVVTIDVDPFIEIGPVEVAWHGLTIALGLIFGGWMAVRFARERGLDPDLLLNLILIIAVAGMAGAKLVYLAENDAAALVAPGQWLDSNGYSFYGGIVFGVPAAALYLRWRHLGVSYLDAAAAGFPVGMAIGRIGDVINGEHYGPPSDLPWAVRNTHPEADVPSNLIAYHSGGLYEVIWALVMLAIIWPLRHRFRRPGSLLAAVIALYAAGRLLMFFARDDSTTVVAGLSFSQWLSLVLIAAAGAGYLLSRRGDEAARRPAG